MTVLLQIYCESVRERMLKISQHLAKLRAVLQWLVSLLTHSVHVRIKCLRKHLIIFLSLIILLCAFCNVTRR